MSKEIKGYVNKPKMSHGPQSCQDPTCLIYNSYLHITRCGQLHSAKILMIIANQVKAIILQTTTKSNYNQCRRKRLLLTRSFFSMTVAIL